MDEPKTRTRRGIWSAVASLWLIVSVVLMYLLKDAPRGESLLELVSFSLGVAAGALVFLAVLLWICWWLFYRLPVKLWQRWGRRSEKQS